VAGLSVPIIILSGFVAVASAFDLYSRRIPNPLLVAGLLVAVAWNAASGGWGGFTESFAGFWIGLALMLPGWLLRFTGGGDVKLVAVVGAFVGASTVVYAFALSMIVAAVFAVASSTYAWLLRGAAAPTMRYWVMINNLLLTGRWAYIRPNADEAVGRRFPLAPAIALGSVGAAVWFS